MLQTIYVDRCGGRFEARFWSYDEQRYFRYSDFDRNAAIKKCARAVGCKEYRVVDTY